MSRHDLDDARAIAKRWYTEQRGRIIGNTPSWDELGQGQRTKIVVLVIMTLETMDDIWSHKWYIEEPVRRAHPPQSTE